MIVATTSRLTIRRFREDDLPRLTALFADPLVMRHSDTGPMGPDYARARLDAGLADPGPATGTWAVQAKQDPLLLGYVRLYCDPAMVGVDALELGYRLLPEAWGHGYASEAAAAILAHGFATTETSRILAFVDPQNAASLAVIRKLGMTRIGEKMVDGYDHPDWVFAARRRRPAAGNGGR